VHYLVLDAYQHEFGPDSAEAHWALGYVDGELGRLLEALARAELREATAIAIVSDHGFSASRRTILPNVWLAAAGLASEVGVAANGGVAGVTVRPDGARGVELLERLGKELAGLPGVAAVYGADDFAALGLPRPGAHPHAPDLVLAAEPDAYFGNDAAGPVIGPARQRGMHGHPPTTTWLTTAMIVAGPGVAAGARVRGAELAEVGATAAALLGIAFPDGARPLGSALSGG
jgi:predicted AlkP superfamily pyrophosphatase or phosphodiesterase